ncbi:MAG: PDZ domain-containing protein [Woeseiaceae bacterium]|nr:PDZ domain-containing protein [Woeseiaceae bacterium]
MSRIVGAIVISLLAGLAIGALLGNGDLPASPTNEPSDNPQMPGVDASVEERIAYLEQVVVQERDARIALEDTLAALFQDLERLESADRRAVSARNEADRQREERQATQSRRGARNDADWLARYRERRIGRLVEGGFTEDEARRTLELESQVAFTALQSSWEAQRSGDPLDPFSAGLDPQTLIRKELGDAAFERYLTAQGQPTSIGISQVYSGSPGSEAGLQAGDRLVSYDGERVYSMTELRRQTMQGAPGENVVLEVERDGMRIQLSVPRGPIGITGNGARVRGMNWWGG